MSAFRHYFASPGCLIVSLLCLASFAAAPAKAASINLSQEPLFLTQSQPPLVMLTMARDHKLYYEAYNDYSDLDDDGTLDLVYKPGKIDYYGYFDSYKCYDYDSTKKLFAPKTATNSPVFIKTDGSEMSKSEKESERLARKKCGGRWSGDWLNYVTTSRMDALRKVLYGGYRSTDTSSKTVLERAFIPQDAHAWGKEYQSVTRDGYDISDFTPLSAPDSGKYHLFANVTRLASGDASGDSTVSAKNSPPVLRYLGNTTYRVWEWLSIERPVAGADCATGNNVRNSCGTIIDRVVRVEVCNSTVGLESNCRAYGSSPVVYKPTGLLQKYGENEGMFFGLLSGSYTNNTRGGVLRKNIASINDEIDSATGALSSSVGIIKSIDRLRVTGFKYSDHTYSCGWITTQPMKNGECNMWGNPIGEMVLEAIRYFAGKSSPTSSFVSGVSSGTSTDSLLGLPLATWSNPYRTGGFPYCSKPFLMAISDVYPSFDSDSLPGSKFCQDESNSKYPCDGTTFGTGDLPSFDMETLGQTIWDQQFGVSVSKSVFIGQSGNTYDSAPTPKTVSSFGNIRGLAPSEPTRQGGYAAAIAAYYGHINDVSSAATTQKTSTYAIALAAPLPTIEVPMGSDGSGKITIVPFAKSVGGQSIQATQGKFQPTNQIVDFYAEQIDPASGTYKFRINYEDVEQGADHDMDAIASYEIKKLSDNLISVTLNSSYAAGGITQHMGYVIAGAKEVTVSLNNAGQVTNTCLITTVTPKPTGALNSVYLDVRDLPDGGESQVDYYLDTRYDPKASCSSTVSNAGTTLGQSRTRYFQLDTSATATLQLKDPLWYMAKFGGFSDDNGNLAPDDTEWDADGDGVPDNYFLVVNPLELEAKMDAALSKISKNSGTAAALATNSTSLKSSQALYQARFSSDGWGGELNAYPIDKLSGAIGSCDSSAVDYDPTRCWRAHYVMGSGTTKISPATRVVLTYDPEKGSGNRGIPFSWASMTPGGALQSSLNKAWNSSGGTTDGNGQNRLLFLRGGEPTGYRQRPYIKDTSIVNFLGDIVNSSVQYVGAPAFDYRQISYGGFYTKRKERTAMLYVGANDGMLHGFEAESGLERLAYIPSPLYRKARLSKLTAADYGKSTNPHAFYVDGTPTIGDVCEGTCDDADSWHTLLLGGLGAGGQGIYAIDITNPDLFTEDEANAKKVVKWEFTDANDADLGYTFSRPAIVRLCATRDVDTHQCTATRWVVVFGNGYANDDVDGQASTSSYAHFFILDALTGEVLKKLTTIEAGTPNGLGTVAPADLDGDGIVDFAYGADLKGNMWKFDLSTIDGAKVAYLLYQAQTTSGTAQPITTTPEIVLHPLGGTMVLFGTGKYIEPTDKTSSLQQTIYGIWDKSEATTGVLSLADKSNLQQQSLVSGSVTSDGAEYASSTANGVDWANKSGWYLNLATNGANPSERVGYDPQMLSKVLNVVTIIPSSDICDYGGDSWDYLLDPITGARPDYAAFAGVGKVILSSGASAYASRRKSKVGISPTGTTVSAGRGEGIIYKGGSTGELEKFGINLQFGLGRRLSWRELETD